VERREVYKVETFLSKISCHFTTQHIFWFKRQILAIASHLHFSTPTLTHPIIMRELKVNYKHTI